ncbi:MAG: ubiquinol-cytochrome c reductase cytochrome c subunit [Baekduia sp.]|nr:ubiquinol-cytochrome c reductase cytochrome c subunit [Baekduia sp.]
MIRAAGARLPASLRVAAVGLLAGLAACAWVARGGTAPAASAAGAGAGVARGAALYAESCSDCHGADLRGLRGRGPTLRGVGAASVDFYLSTGRMPLSRPGIEPPRAAPVYGRRDIDALIAYVTRIGPGGPAIPQVDPARGTLPEGRRLYTDNCSGCHQIMGAGGIAPGLVAPPLNDATPRQIGEAIRVGPYLMPRFSSRRLTDRQVASVARYITEVAQHPPDRGGWGIGHIGPVPEGLVAFLLAGSALLLVARLIGERTET